MRTTHGSRFGQLEAVNLWLWDGLEPIVREQTIRDSATAQGRVIDLTFRFAPLKDGVSVARRGMAHYGGLNLRLATPASQGSPRTHRRLQRRAAAGVVGPQRRVRRGGDALGCDAAAAPAKPGLPGRLDAVSRTSRGASRPFRRPGRATRCAVSSRWCCATG